MLQAIPEPGEPPTKRPNSKIEPLMQPLGTVAETMSVFTSGNMSFGSYPLKRNAAPAKHGHAGHSGMYGFSQTPPSGSLPAQLAGNHSRRVGAEHHARAQDRTPEASLSEEQTTPTVLHREGRGVHAGRDPKHARQAGHISDRGGSREFLLPDVPVPPKRRQAETCNKSIKAQPLCEDRALQNRGHSHAERSAKSRRLDGQDRPERCLFYDSHCSGGQRFPQIPMEGPDVSVQLSSVRVVVSPVGLYQDHTASCGNPAGNRPTSDHLHRRYPRHGGDRVSPQRPCDSSGVPAGEPGVCGNHPKSELDPSQEIEFLGFTVNSKTMELKLPGEKIKKIRAEAGKVLQSDTVSALALSWLIGKMNAATQAIPMAPLYYRNLQTCLREVLQEDQSYSSTTVLTKEAREELEWWRDHFTQWNGQSLIAHNSSLTMPQKRVGGGVQWSPHRGPWTPKERTMHINCLELLAAFLAVK